MKKILVGVDGSPRAPKVLQQALDLATQSGGRLLVARAVSIPVEMPVRAMSMPLESLPALLVDIARKEVEALVAEVPRERLERIEVRLGTPWQVLCDLAKAEHADMVVIGTHGYTALDRLLGTTAARVVNHAPCTVVVVRDRSGQPPMERRTA
jgi:nucleotide-binding universal stress UspA family protein